MDKSAQPYRGGTIARRSGVTIGRRLTLDLPTETWTDLLHEQHDRAFSVAGAAHADLVSDLRGAVDQAVAEGTTLATFRRDFDAIVAKHGWSYNGGRDWRTEVIYATNLRASYAAGRYQQMLDGAERRPYWRYRHSDASEHPRHDHLAWDGLVLRHDDPWWDTHYPPNGWGCKCFVDALNARDLKRLGKSGPDTAPPVRTRTVTVGAKGPSPRTLTIPEGIDPGWAYAPGQSVARRTPPEDPWALPEITRADVSAARQVGGQGGSNPGGLYQFPDGALRYVKLYRGPDATAQAYGEAVANRAYRALGLDAPASVLVRDGDAIVGVGNAIIDHAGIIGAKLGRGGQNWQPDGRSQAPPKGRSREVLKGYAADVKAMPPMSGSRTGMSSGATWTMSSRPAKAGARSRASTRAGRCSCAGSRGARTARRWRPSPSGTASPTPPSTPPTPR